MSGTIAARVRAWMWDDALPFWTQFGLDRVHGGYVERFDLAGVKPFVDVKRTRVVGRQLYVFSHAALLGAPTLAAAEHGYRFLRDRLRLADGWPRTAAADGAAVDPTPDLYDYAFVLFGLAWYARASKDASAIDLADWTLEIIERRFASPAGGYQHALPPTGWRQQNPHMHLLEAALALHETTGVARYAALARRLIGLFQAKFYDRRTQTLAEFFTEDWARAAGDDGRRVEPGHQFEWAWILNAARKSLGLALSEEIRGLVDFAERTGFDPKSRAVVQAVHDDGAPLDPSSRTWPNCERIKAAVALFELDGVDPAPAFQSSAGVLLDRYLAREPRGVWNEVYDGAGRLIADHTPASTLYHVFLAFAELLRVSDASAARSAG